MQDLREQYDAVYISIGAHTDKKMGIEGEDSQGVISAVEMLREVGRNRMPDFKGKEWLSLAAVMWPWTVPDRLFVWEQIKLPVYTEEERKT